MHQFLGAVLLTASLIAPSVALGYSDEPICGLIVACPPGSSATIQDGTHLELESWQEALGTTVPGDDASGETFTVSDASEPNPSPDTPGRDLSSLCTDNLSPIACAVPRPTPGAPAPPDAPAFVIPTVYAADLASFFPHEPAIVGEPAGAGLIGKPANIVASSAPHILNGTLFDHAVAVLFAPAGYTFDYGDGATIASDTGGETWAATDAPPFSAAPTAHAYAARGEYTATVTVAYAAAVNFGDGVWRDVVGTVSASAAYSLRVYQPTSALVNFTCLEKPDGVGC